ncbi:TPA: hypothetical protein ACSTL1_002006 [Serratia fonticola]
MKITSAMHDTIYDNRTRDFVTNGVENLSANFSALIAMHNITEEALAQAVTQSYQWTEDNGRPSQLLAIRVCSARLCFGSFFMQDSRFHTLKQIVLQELNALYLADDDPIHGYLVEYQQDWTRDWFEEQMSLILSIVVPQHQPETNQPRWHDPSLAINKLFVAEGRSYMPADFAEFSAMYQALHKISTQALPVNSDDHAHLLLTIAQYYDGAYCFNDPLRPRWHNCLAAKEISLRVYHLQQCFMQWSNQIV